MTADRAALVEKMADAIAKAWDEHGRVIDAATAAIDLIRAETLEEAARVADEDNSVDGDFIAAAIRALKGDT
jgi:ribulose-5-phosphate 4-epimerase/fuculose-1-phosphate aldolase